MDAATTDTLALFGLDEPICPYTGLRTFTEDEAIYFRGRETHVVKALALLAEQRFVMITGASGDGKSSLVFAGLLPEVRAGFVRARYGSWAVATFRPERSPLRNLATALATALRLPSVSTIETELEHGFAALVQLYKTSALCPAPVPLGTAPAEERRQQREAANLLLVVDQFEEFFTNPENYDGDTPNTAAQTVVNLLLETTRLAQAEGLPIHIVCTMRSDFVGQCAEFRGLIEQVGASQYFVPRLVRHEFVEVIREPALLSGNRISERLVQRLLYDIGHGQDQLPVLQHALRRIWLAADEGREEMDLLHYAMVGGLAGELPAADQARFAQWRATLPAQQQEFLLAAPSLHNVLDAHANQLFAEANALYNRDFTPALPPGTAERVIEQTFRVLTRTDGKRVVRNRLTGAQITAILDDESLPWPVVCRILRPFRAPGATFLSPFVQEGDDDRAVLPPDAVLDLTHESLIRNWQYLARWASAEAADVRIAESFVQQAGRWQANDESAGFLLPIGLYTFFAQWHRAKKGAASWLAYYFDANPGADAAQRQEQAEAQNSMLTRYLKASRRRLRFPLLVARYGAGRLAAAVLLPALLVALVWLGVRYRRQQSDYVAYSIVQEYFDREQMVQKPPFLAVRDMATFFLNTDRLRHHIYQPALGGKSASDYAFPHLLDSLANDTLALDIELSMYACVSNVEYDSVARENPYIRPVLHDLERRLVRAGDIARPAPGAVAVSEPQRRVAVLTARTIMALTHYLTWDEQHRARPRPGGASDSVRQHLAASRQHLLRRLRDYVRQEIQTTSGGVPSPAAFGFCLRVLLGQGTDSPTELAFLEGMSPFGPPEAVRQFRRLFPPQLALYARGSITKYSGGYLSAAMAFAALRQPAQVLRCLAVLRQQVRVSDANGGIALLPYLVKYELLTPQNTHELLRACARVGDFPFNEIYAATVYSLLSVSPSPLVFDVSQRATIANLNRADATRLGGIDPGFLNVDRVSFSVPAATRDKAWAALQGSSTEIADHEAVFIESEEHDLADGVPEAYYNTRDELFLRAFLAKMHGVYLAEIKRQPTEAAQSFASFSQALQQLQQHLASRHGRAHTSGRAHDAADATRPSAQLINSVEWNLGEPQLAGQVGGLTQGSIGAQSPELYLRLPTRPKTLAFETYYTCPFDAFFRYELAHEAAAPQPNPAVVQLLDSVTFVEAAFPDRNSSTRTRSLLYEAIARPAQYRTNLAWMRALARTPLPTDNAARRQRNALLLLLTETAQNHQRLTQPGLLARLQPGLRLLPGQPDFSKLPLQVAFSDLATALAHEGRVADAFALADALGEPLTTITKIRACEQAMLTNNQKAEGLMDNFLRQYHRNTLAPYEGIKGLKPRLVAGNLLSVFYWRPYATDRPRREYLEMARQLVNFNNDERNSANDLYAKCIGYSLADECYVAKSQMPAYQSIGLEQIDYNYILLGWAHLKTTTPGDGWREYDDIELTTPADYTGSVD